MPPGVPHWVIVRTADGSDIVAERTLTGGASGVSYTIGLPVAATRWFATIVGNSQPTSQLSIANPSATETATVTVRGIGGGSIDDIAGAVDLTVAPGERRVDRPLPRRRPGSGAAPRSRSCPTSAWSSASG